VAFWLNFGEINISIDLKRTPVEIPLLLAVLRSVGIFTSTNF
jgi:hypothetical protein